MTDVHRKGSALDSWERAGTVAGTALIPVAIGAILIGGGIPASSRTGDSPGSPTSRRLVRTGIGLAIAGILAALVLDLGELPVIIGVSPIVIGIILIAVGGSTTRRSAAASRSRAAVWLVRAGVAVAVAGVLFAILFVWLISGLVF